MAPRSVTASNSPGSRSTWICPVSSPGAPVHPDDRTTPFRAMMVKGPSGVDMVNNWAFMASLSWGGGQCTGSGFGGIARRRRGLRCRAPQVHRGVGAPGTELAEIGGQGGAVGRAGEGADAVA